MPLHSLPLFVRLADRPVILLGEGDTADAKRRLLLRAGARIVGEDTAAALAIVAIDDEAPALAAVARLQSRGILVNAVDRPDHCDFTLPAIVDRNPLLVAIGTGGVSAGLAAGLRQRLETLLPTTLGGLADALHAGRATLRARFPDAGTRRRAIADALKAGGPLDPLAPGDPAAWLANPAAPAADATETIVLRSPDPDDLTLREARLLASADRVFHTGAPAAILDRARADAARIHGSPRVMPGLSVVLLNR